MRITSMYVMVLFLTALSNTLYAGEGKSQGGGAEPECELIPVIVSL